MVLAWIAVAMAFAAPLGAGVVLEGRIARRRAEGEGPVALLYLWIPLAAAFAVAMLLRTHL